jgi:hypothetical protein
VILWPLSGDFWPLSGDSFSGNAGLLLIKHCMIEAYQALIFFFDIFKLF